MKKCTRHLGSAFNDAYLLYSPFLWQVCELKFSTRVVVSGTLAMVLVVAPTLFGISDA